MSVTIDDVRQAAERLRGHAVVTPLVESAALNDRVGGRVLMKLESLQNVGAFKFRGAYNLMAQLGPEARSGGVVAFSSGNHAQGVALAARRLGLRAVIVMPADAPAAKIAATRGYGAEIRLYDRLNESREAIAADIAAERGAALVKPFDDPRIVAGQGTVGLEMAAQAEALGAAFDVVLTPVSGGGLISGVAVAVQAARAATEVIAVEPEAYDDTARSLAAGERVSVQPGVRTLCDALESPAPGEITFPIMRQRLAGAVAVSDAEAAEAVRYAFGTLKLVLEPSGAVPLAALLSGKLAAGGRTIGLVLSGGNVDAELFARIVAGAL